MPNTKRIGALGEELAVKFLMKRGYKILDRNYRRPWGELDIVAERRGKIHFVEVKALVQKISDETVSGSKSILRATQVSVSDETKGEQALRYIRSRVRKDRFRPEENVNSNKIKRLSRIIQTYLIWKHVSDETSWQFDVATVLIDEETQKAKVDFLENIILEQRQR